MLDHNTRIAKLSTRIAQLHDQLNDFEKKESKTEEKFINQIDIKRTNVNIFFYFILSFIY